MNLGRTKNWIFTRYDLEVITWPKLSNSLGMRGLLTYSIVRADGQIMAATAVKKCRARGKKRGNMAGLAGLAGVGLSARQVPQKDSWQVRTDPQVLLHRTCKSICRKKWPARPHLSASIPCNYIQLHTYMYYTYSIENWDTWLQWRY